MNGLTFLNGNLTITPGPDATSDERREWGYMLQHFARGHADELLAEVLSVVRLVEAAHPWPVVEVAGERGEA